MKKNKYYHYINIMNFGGIDKRVGCEVSLYELPKDEINTIINNYMIRFKVDEELYQKIYKLLYEREKLIGEDNGVSFNEIEHLERCKDFVGSDKE